MLAEPTPRACEWPGCPKVAHNYVETGKDKKWTWACEPHLVLFAQEDEARKVRENARSRRRGYNKREQQTLFAEDSALTEGIERSWKQRADS